MARPNVRWLIATSSLIVACASKQDDGAAAMLGSMATAAPAHADGGMPAKTQAGQAGSSAGAKAAPPSTGGAGTTASAPTKAGGSLAQAAAAGSGASAQAGAAAAATSAGSAGSAGHAGHAGDAGDAGNAGSMTVTNKWPVAADGWPEATTADFGLDKAAIDAAADKLQTASGNTRAGLVVVKEGVLVYEKYWQGAAETAHQVFSCTKSWGSTLIGIAVHNGLLEVDDPVTKWVPQPAAEVGTGALLKHLLTQTAHTTPPGMEFAYNSGSIVNTLPEALEAASMMSSHAFFETKLAKPLQLSMVWPSCAAGGCAGTRYKADYIQFGDQGPNGVLQSTIRDQAKLGWLWLNDGVWNGERLLDSDYIHAATEPSFDFQALYGYLWWLNREGKSVGPLGASLSYNPDVPNDMFHAVGGIGNCSIGAFPTQKLVIVHVGDLDTGGLGGHWELFKALFQ